jgi:hypothetical protein
MFMRRIASMLLLVAMGGCTSLTEPGLIAGSWSEDFTVAGSGLDMLLSVNGSIISGTGHWSGEALGSGTTVVAGTLSSGVVTLVTTYDNGTIENFSGALHSSDALSGIVSDSVPGQPRGGIGLKSYHRD